MINQKKTPLDDNTNLEDSSTQFDDNEDHGIGDVGDGDDDPPLYEAAPYYSSNRKT